MGSREELEKIVGPTAVDERPVRDLWPLAIMQERAGNVPPQVLVVRPAGREQVAALLRWATSRSEEHTSELQSLAYLVCRLLLEKKKKKKKKKQHKTQK